MTMRHLAMGTALAVLMTAPLSAWADGALMSVGLAETVRLQPENIDIRAKVDTGAENSSIDTQTWETFDRDGATWIRFTLRLDNSNRQTLERPLHRMAEIHRAGSTQSRPVVLMTLCVGTVAREVEVNLSERPKLTYRMLLGASFLTGAYVVDVSQSNLTRPICGETAK